MTETSMNPNVPVGGEGSTASKANSSITFDDVADTEDAPKAKPKLAKEPEKKPAAKEKPPVRQGAKDEASSFEDAEEDGDDKSPTPKAKPEKAAAEKDDKEPAKAKPKVHKFKAGEQTLDLAGDAVLTVVVDGKKEEVTLQQVLDNHSGKTNWDRKNNELRNERTEFTKERESMNALVTNLFEKASKNPEDAYDFLADLTKQDPVKLKGSILRQQFEELLPLYEMSEQEREHFFKDRERDWRDKAHENRTRADSEREASTREEAERTSFTQKYGIDDDRYAYASKIVHKHLKDTDPKFDGKVTPQQVIHADRHLMALEVIAEATPHLEKHEKFDSIVGDIVNDLIRHPGMTREKLASLLRDIWVDDNKGLKNLARKAAKNAQSSDDERPARKSERREPVTFDDLD